MAPLSSRGGEEPSPESLFVAWLRQREAGRAPAFEELCRAHPHAAERLCELERLQGELEEVERRFGVAGTVAERLARLHGSDLDPKVELEGEAAPDFTSKLLGRLSGRGASSSRYRLKGEIASGGMGAILRVWDEDLRRHLAMKVELADRAADGGAPRADRRKLARFLEEAQVTGQLDHPNIVPVHELGLDAEGRVYFTMKLVKGRELKAIFDLAREGREGWSEVRALGVLLKVCEAMSYAHDKGVLHRDLKPANVMVGRYGEVYVMDWGLARILGRPDAKDIRVRPADASAATGIRTEREAGGSGTPDAPLYTLDGDVVGTPAYMPPEQAQGDLSAIGPHSDVYAVGAMLYHLLAGHMPYLRQGESASNYAIWRWVREGPPRPLSDEAPAAAPELVAICERAMSRDLASRYRDMTALAADLSAYLEHRVVAAYETGTWAETRKWIRRNRSLALASAAAVLVLIVGLAASLFFKSLSDRNARVALERARDVESANGTISRQNGELLAAIAGARESEQRALENERRARSQEELATARANDVLSLSAIEDLEELGRRADALWPAEPGTAAACERWLQDAQDLIAGRASDAARGIRGRPSIEEHREKLSRLRSRGKPRAAGGYEFEDPDDRWWHDQLSKLVAGLDLLRDPERGLFSAGISEAHGWGVLRRAEFASTIREVSVDGAEPQRLWKQAVLSVAANPKYGGLVLAPQVGLLPLGPDRASGLEEFAHLQTGEPARRGADGELDPRPETGLVLVLIPGGPFWMGAQATDPSGRNYDPLARPDEAPVHEVVLGPYLLSKYEMTQAQWLRIAGRNPSIYKPPEPLSPTLRHPVECISWFDAKTMLDRLGLVLPSEAQWENAARAGTSTPWTTGAERESLRGLVNLADRTAREGGASWTAIQDWPDLVDGAVAHAEVGRYPPNGFGLHEVIGNVWEWCRDGLDATFYAKPAGADPVRDAGQSDLRVTRGGSLNSTAMTARSAYRDAGTAEDRGYHLGVRPARQLVR